eukprot:3420781-Rhodomonas_salina.1
MDEQISVEELNQIQRTKADSFRYMIGWNHTMAYPPLKQYQIPGLGESKKNPNPTAPKGVQFKIRPVRNKITEKKSIFTSPAQNTGQLALSNYFLPSNSTKSVASTQPKAPESAPEAIFTANNITIPDDPSTPFSVPLVLLSLPEDFDEIQTYT